MINRQSTECWSCGEKGQWRNECNKPKTQERQGGGVAGANTVGAEVATSSLALAAVVNGRSDVKDGYYEEWQFDSGSIDHVSPDETGMADYTQAEPWTTLEIADKTFVLVKGFGDICVIIQQKMGDKAATLKRGALMPDAKRNLFEGKIVVKTSGKKMFFPHMAYLGKVCIG